MTNKKLIEKLKKFPDDMEVIITDGYEATCYHGNFDIKKFKETDGTETIDIGIGGMAFSGTYRNKTQK